MNDLHLNTPNENEENQDVSKEPGRKPRRGLSFKLGGVSINAKTILQCETELEPLERIIPNDSSERLKWMLNIQTKPAHFDVEWDVLEDSRLLLGVYIYGMGSWEAIKMDPSLGISEKILISGDQKPQGKHLNTRCEYLLKLLGGNGGRRKKREGKPKKEKQLPSKEVIENDVISSDNEPQPKKAKPISPVKKTAKSEDEVREPKPKRDPSKSKKKQAGPMHFTANNEPRALEVLGDLDPSIFNQCKELMRPVKKSLKALDNPDQSLPEAEQVTHTRQCLLQIGNQINKCLVQYEKDHDKAKEWRSNLWYFVSKFTVFDAKKLYKIYKHAAKKANIKEAKEQKEEKKEKKKEKKKDKLKDKEKKEIKKESKKEKHVKDGADSSSHVKRRLEEKDEKNKRMPPHHNERER